MYGLTNTHSLKSRIIFMDEYGHLYLCSITWKPMVFIDFLSIEKIVYGKSDLLFIITNNNHLLVLCKKSSVFGRSMHLYVPNE